MAKTESGQVGKWAGGIKPAAPAPASPTFPLSHLPTFNRPNLTILIKRLARVQSLRDWWFKEAREGGYLERYIRQEKHQMPERVRAVARKFVDWKQPTKTDFQLRAAIPARLFHRLKEQDPHFFDDNQNLRKLKSDNPELTIKL